MSLERCEERCIVEWFKSCWDSEIRPRLAGGGDKGLEVSLEGYEQGGRACGEVLAKSFGCSTF